jgi:phosphoglycerate dehydrogenase-like enzyme
VTRKRVALLDPFTGVRLETVATAIERAGFDFLVVSDRGDAAQAAALDRADYAIAVTVPFRGANLPTHDRLKMMHKWGAGYDAIDVAALRARGIPLLRTAGANANYVAELALALMIMSRRNLARADRALRSGTWEAEKHWADSSSLFGKTVGLVGYGAIARALEGLLAGFGCTVLKTTRRPGAGDDFVPLPVLFERADVISLHVPLSDETRGMVDGALLSRMKPDAILVNTARGGLVDEAALVRTLEARAIGGAGLDVYATEPLPPNHPLLRLDNVVLTPHLGGKVRENLVGVVAHIVRNISLFDAGKPLPAADLVQP